MVVSALQTTNPKDVLREVGIDQVMCTYCRKVMTSWYNAMKHFRRVHLKLRPHPCRFCPRRFCTSYDARRHEMTCSKSSIRQSPSKTPQRPTPTSAAQFPAPTPVPQFPAPESVAQFPAPAPAAQFPTPTTAARLTTPAADGTAVATPSGGPMQPLPSPVVFPGQLSYTDI